MCGGTWHALRALKEKGRPLAERQRGRFPAPQLSPAGLPPPPLSGLLGTPQRGPTSASTWTAYMSREHGFAQGRLRLAPWRKTPTPSHPMPRQPAACGWLCSQPTFLTLPKVPLPGAQRRCVPATARSTARGSAARPPGRRAGRCLSTRPPRSARPRRARCLRGTAPAGHGHAHARHLGIGRLGACSPERGPPGGVMSWLSRSISP